ncbi:MAG: SPFH domain-containing protein [Lachnospiraceae bacterium]|nr:SPFH domain-containing protein [Lachnospiraceae bacterium]
MGFFQNQLLNVIEWDESKEGVIFWKWPNDEIKKGSKLFIRPGQDAIFLHNGRIEGVFEDDGEYDIETEIIPFLSSLKGFKFGFNSGFRAEVIFINTKELLCKWGTKNAINVPAPGLPGGMPIRAFGTFNCKVMDFAVMLEKLSGTMQTYSVEDVKTRITASLDQLLMSWIGKEGRDMFNLQMDARNIAKGLEEDLDMEMRNIGIGITGFTIESFNYPEEVKKMQEKAAAQSMIGDINKYSQVAMADSIGKGDGGGNGANLAGQMMGVQMGMMMGQQMMNNINMTQGMNQAAPAPQAGAPTGAPAGGGTAPKFCPNCGTATNGAKFCSNCGQQLV